MSANIHTADPITKMGWRTTASLTFDSLSITMSHNKHLQFTLELTVRQVIIIIAINSFNLYGFSHSEHKTLHRTYCMSYLLLSTCNFQSIESKSSVRNNIVMYQKQDENSTQRSLIAREVAPIFRIPWTRGFTLKEIFVKVTRNQGLDREVWTTFSYVDRWKNRNWVSEYGSVIFNRNIYWIVIITTRLLPIITSDRLGREWDLTYLLGPWAGSLQWNCRVLYFII